MLGGTEGRGWRGWGQWARGHLGGDGTKRGWGCREGLGAELPAAARGHAQGVGGFISPLKLHW